MEDTNRTPKQLQEEVVRLRKRLAELEALEAKHAQVEKDLTAAREELGQRERFLSNVFSSIQDGLSILDKEMNIIRVNPTMERWYSHAMPLKDKKCFRAYHEREEYCEVCPTRKTLKTGEAAYEIVPKIGAGGKGVGWLDLYSFPLFDKATGQLKGVIEYVRDITDRKKAEDELHQSQKMDAVGRLAGGVSHDLNNLLTAVGAYADLLLMDLPEGSPSSLQVVEIKKAVEQAAALTGQLLAFSRKQVLQPKVLDLNGVVGSMASLLRRLIGENVELEILQAEDTGHVRADPGQLEQVILNLVVNGRDAMPQGGNLTLETAPVDMDESRAREGPGIDPGPYAMLVVTDTGCGMDDEVLSHIFEPFFTTKERHKGTGLGLSTVFGIVKQSKGGISVSSKPGTGTTFRIYLPRVPDVPPETTPEPIPAPPLVGTETVLLVEDETSIRKAVRQALQRSGYRILEAPNPGEALLISEQHTGFIHLMLTDVVMPRMSGPHLVERLEPWHPEMKVLYMSGYSEKHILEDEILPPGAAFLRKPFAIKDLLKQVRRVLDTPKGG